MAKMKWDRDIDWRGLNDAEYDPSDGDWTEYDGEIPPKNTLLTGRLKKLWVAETSKGDTYLKALFEADGNDGSKKEYNGCPIWDNVLFTMPQVKFRWQPFLDAFGLTLADIKNKTVVDDADQQTGTPVLRIGDVKLGEKGVLCRVKTGRENDPEYGLKATVGRWLPAADEEDFDDEDEFDEEDGDEEDPF